MFTMKPEKHKPSKVAARQLKAAVDLTRESPNDKQKADERLLFGSVLDQKTSGAKPAGEDSTTTYTED